MLVKCFNYGSVTEKLVFSFFGLFPALIDEPGMVLKKIRNNIDLAVKSQ